MKKLTAAAVLALGLPGVANAHLVGTEFGDFYAGALHLVSGPEYLALLLALGLVVASAPATIGRWALATLPAAFAVGAAIALVTAPVLELRPAIAALLAVLGAVAIYARPLPLTVLALSGAFAGLLLGFDNALPGAVDGIDRWLYGAGVVVTGTVLGTIAIAVARHLRANQSWAILAQRVLGSWVTAIGTLFLGSLLLT